MNLSDDDFTLFGLPQRFGLDRGALDARWRELQAQVHPDKFASEGAAAQRTAMQWSVRVNEAYRRLREPLARAAYLCGLRGSAVDAENNTAMPADFLMQQMAWRESLDEASDIDGVQVIQQAVQAAEAVLLEELRALLDDADDPASVTTAAERVRALMFVARFREDIERRAEALEQ